MEINPYLRNPDLKRFRNPGVDTVSTPHLLSQSRKHNGQSFLRMFEKVVQLCFSFKTNNYVHFNENAFENPKIEQKIISRIFLAKIYHKLIVHYWNMKKHVFLSKNQDGIVEDYWIMHFWIPQSC